MADVGVCAPPAASANNFSDLCILDATILLYYKGAV